MNWRNLLLVAGIGLGMGAAPSCVIRAQARPAFVVDQAPPAAQYETRPARSGHVWVKGKWEWRHNRWKWKRGHYVRIRAGHRYEDGRWEQRANRWHWVEGRWIAGSNRQEPNTGFTDHRRPGPAADSQAPATSYPVSPPPAPTYENPAPKAGFVWIRGHYGWTNGAYQWIRGHWEGEKASQVWVEGHWSRSGSHYLWTPGQWSGVKARVIRTER